MSETIIAVISLVIGYFFVTVTIPFFGAALYWLAGN